MGFLVLAILVFAAVMLNSIVKSTKERAFEEGLIQAEKRRAFVEQKAREAKPMLAQCDQSLLYLILDIFSKRIRGDLCLPQPVYSDRSYIIHPLLIDWVCKTVADTMSLNKLPDSVYENPWTLYEQTGPMALRPKDYMDDAKEKINEMLEESEEEAWKLLCEACQPFLERAETTLNEKRERVFSEVSRLCHLLKESGFVTIEEQLVPRWQKVVNGVPTQDLIIHYDPEHKGEMLVTYLIFRPRLGPHTYEPYEVARSYRW